MSTAEPYMSCRFLQTGLNFSAARVNACAIIHHNTGEPALIETYSGGPLNLAALLAARQDLIGRVQAGRLAECLRCPYLEKKVWPAPAYPVEWLGITNWLGCNLACNYCWLEWSAWSPRKQPVKRYSHHYDVSQALDTLLAERWLAPYGLVDWGGGGEPTLMPLFDHYLPLLADYGVTQWLHTNATRLPRPIAKGTVDASRLKVLCSVDAGSQQTYQALKQTDRYDTVWRNLSIYLDRSAEVTVKYIVTPENCGLNELKQFVKTAAAHKIPTIIGDIDHRLTRPDPKIITGLAHLQTLSLQAGIYYVYGSTGDRHNPEADVPQVIERKLARLRAAKIWTDRARFYLAKVWPLRKRAQV